MGYIFTEYVHIYWVSHLYYIDKMLSQYDIGVIFFVYTKELAR